MAGEVKGGILPVVSSKIGSVHELIKQDGTILKVIWLGDHGWEAQKGTPFFKGTQSFATSMAVAAEGWMYKGAVE